MHQFVGELLLWWETGVQPIGSTMTPFHGVSKLTLSTLMWPNGCET